MARDGNNQEILIAGVVHDQDRTPLRVSHIRKSQRHEKNVGESVDHVPLIFVVNRILRPVLLEKFAGGELTPRAFVSLLRSFRADVQQVLYQPESLRLRQQSDFVQ